MNSDLCKCNETEQISQKFAVVEHKESLFPSIAKSPDKIIIGRYWKFDPKTLKIYNNLYWKRFYGRGNDLLTTALRFFGFYKRFRYVNNERMEGTTHPFETPKVNAKNIATKKYVLGYGKVIHLEYKLIFKRII